MSVIHLLTPEYLPKVGGVADYTRVVARGLAKAGHDVHVWCPANAQGRPADPFVVHPELGSFSGSDLRRAGHLFDRFPQPRRMLVQWVPHGYGYRAMNVRFCCWLWQRAIGGDQVELMVHEPYLDMWEGTWRQTAAAIVHRVMTVVLLQAAQRVWLSIPAWEPKLKPYTLGRSLPFEWLPIPSSLSEPESEVVQHLRAKFGADAKRVIGHLGTYGSLVAPLLRGALVELLRQPDAPQVLLLGTGSDEFRASLVAEHPKFSDFVHAAGALTDDDLAAHVASCDVLIQPYPDGISSRRTTAMAALCLGIPVVTTHGSLTEPLWHDSQSVRLTRVGDHRAMANEVMELLAHPDVRRQLGQAGRELYARRFDLRRTIAALTTYGTGAAGTGAAA